MEIFQQRFLQAKEQSGLRWVDIANQSGLDKASISQYKNGVHVPEPDALYKLSMVLGVTMEWLTGADVPKVTVGDRNIINRYHRLNDRGKAEFMRFLDTLLSDKNYKR
jgi:transcriptional regulator with XRE-family HTH domain